MSARPRWFEVAVTAPEAWSELVAEHLAIVFSSGVAFGPASLASEAAPTGCELLRVFASGELVASELEARARRALTRLAGDAGVAELATVALHVRELPPEDFARSWEKRWKPFRVGRLAVVPPGSTRTLRADDLRLVLEPGGAFGTGRHTTTRACLRILQRRLRPGEHVLDAGTGNGVLAVAALLFGASRAVAFDNDVHARPYALQLAEQNDVASRSEFRIGGFEVLTAADRGFDAVFANIYADLIQRHAADLAARLRPGGWFVFSGCHRDHRAATEAAIRAAGLAVEGRSSTGRWDTYDGVRAP